MKLNDLFNISLDKAGVNFLVALPEPQKSPLAKADSKKLFESCKSFRKLWGDLVINKIRIPDIELKNMPKDMIAPSTREEIWDSLFLTISCYYDYSFHRYVELGEKEGLPPGLNLNSIKSFIIQDLDKRDDFFKLRALSFNYFICLFTLYFTSALRGTVIPSGIFSVFESKYHESIMDLYRDCMTLSDRQKNAGLILFQNVLGYAVRVFTELPYNEEYRPGIFSAIKTEELSLIASRNNEMMKRYGIKNLEKIFERQLALIMQSFGIYVVSTWLGSRTVDLLCISSFPNEQYTFLIEAKTTNKPYSLPRKDFRALREYVDDVKRTLHTLPPLRFVLLTAEKPSKTLSDKLRQFQADTGCPIRFISAQQVAELRERIIGLLPPDELADKILCSPYILNDKFISEIEKSLFAVQKAHSDFVESIFSAKGIVRGLGNYTESDV